MMRQAKAADLRTDGAMINERLTTVTGDYDTAVRRKTYGLDSFGRIEYATQYDDPDEGEGTAVDQTRTTYSGWFHVTMFQQDPDSAIGASGRAAYDVQYSYSKSAPSGGRATVRRTGMTMPGGASLTYSYGTGSGLNDLVSRVQDITLSSVTLASYTYLGTAQVVGREFPEPDMLYHQHSSTLGSYPGLDQFGRLKEDLWVKDLSTDVPVNHVTLYYDRGSNIIRTIDAIHRNVNAGNHRWDRVPTLNGRSQLIGLREGHWDGSAITTGNRKREELWTLNQVGAITLNTVDNNGDGDGSDSGEITDARTFNNVNELTARDADNNSGTTGNNYTPAYDATGNLTDDDTAAAVFGHVYKYDPWGRLRKIFQQDGTTLVAEYRYNAYGFQIAEHTDVTRSGGGAPDGTVDTDDPWYFFAYSEEWKKQATYRGSDSSPKARYVNDAAGFDGFGGSSMMNHVVLQDVDTSNGGWTVASTGTYSRREYLLQDYQASVSVVVTSTGRVREWVKYSAYGVPYLIPFTDVNSDGIVNSQDFFDFLSVNGGSFPYDVRCDSDLDGNCQESQDYFDFYAEWSNTYSAGRGLLSRPDVYNRKGYAGYESVNAENRHLLARHRVLDTLTAMWMSRDPHGYVDGPDLYAYCLTKSLVFYDVTGQASQPCGPPAPGEPSKPAPPAPGDSVPYVIPPAKDVQPSDQQVFCANLCAALAKGKNEANAVSWCYKGKPIICQCPVVDNYGAAPGFYASFVKCLEQYEKRNWDFLHCSGEESGKPEPDADAACGKGRNFRQAIECVGSIDCSKEKTDRSRKICEYFKCTETSRYECYAQAWEAACSNPMCDFPDFASCKDKLNKDLGKCHATDWGEKCKKHLQ